MPTEASGLEGLEKLDIVIPRDMGTKKRKDETANFLLYLTYAAQNVIELLHLESMDERKLREEVEAHGEKGQRDLERLADFLWTFQFENPSLDFPDYRELALSVAEKIIALRNLFVHTDKPCRSTFRWDLVHYKLIEGILMGKARNDADGLGLRIDKLNKIKLMNCMDGKGGPKLHFEFTRRGLIFMTCLALYRDEAIEFLDGFEDFHLPARRDEAGAAGRIRKGVPSKRAFREAFTTFSYRRGRNSLPAEEANFMKFADLVGYLNKVPSASMNYLSLDQEREMLAREEAVSTESEENKRFKYRLRPRAKDRFLPLAVGYAEDLDLFPSLLFKRLDVEPSVGRKRYRYGKENDNGVRLDRHYAIVNNGIRFAFRPERHYGPVRIRELRGSIGAAEFKRLVHVAAFMKLNGPTADDTLHGYLAAYHAVLERMVNAKDLEAISLADDELVKDLALVAARTPGEIRARPGLLQAFFPANVVALLTRKDTLLSVSQMQTALKNRLNTILDQTADFLRRCDKLAEWKRSVAALPPDAVRPPMPVCSRKEVLQPPRSCRISDGAFISRVIRYLDLGLSDDRKFRQLPLGEQHRKTDNGTYDHQYQLLHAVIGKYTFSPGDFEKFVSKIRPELSDRVNRLSKRARDILNREKDGKRDPRGRRPGATLQTLSTAAAELYMEECDELRSRYGKETNAEVLRHGCSRFDVKTGRTISKDTMLRAILRIDESAWHHAYDYGEGAPYENRALEDVEHVVSQIPVANGFAERHLAAVRPLNEKNQPFEKLWGTRPDGKVFFDFTKAIMEGAEKLVALRDYYDVAPLVSYAKSHEHDKEEVDPDAEGVANARDEFGRLPRTDFSAPGLRKAIAAIKEAHTQDLVLLRCARTYWERFTDDTASADAVGTFQKDDLPSIRSYFDGRLVFRKGFSDGISLLIPPNDICRPFFEKIRRNAKALSSALLERYPGKERKFDYFEVVDLFQEIQAEDRARRLEIIPLLLDFASRCAIPGSAYANPPGEGDRQQRVRRMEFGYYGNVFPSLTFEEYDEIVRARNDVMHSAALLDTGKALEILERILV